MYRFPRSPYGNSAIINNLLQYPYRTPNPTFCKVTIHKSFAPKIYLHLTSILHKSNQRLPIYSI